MHGPVGKSLQNRQVEGALRARSELRLRATGSSRHERGSLRKSTVQKNFDLVRDDAYPPDTMRMFHELGIDSIESGPALGIVRISPTFELPWRPDMHRNLNSDARRIGQ